jgi:Transposase DDE domain group 1
MMVLSHCSRARLKSATTTTSGDRRPAIHFRGDSHYACPKAMSWCEHNDVDYVFGLTGTKPGQETRRRRRRRANRTAVSVRGYTETRHRAGS